MGYNLYITRKNSCTDETGPDITADEWLAVFDMKMNPVHPANLVNPVQRIPPIRSESFHFPRKISPPP
jgi:hypothetical protein